jgi:hypothetical protein
VIRHSRRNNNNNNNNEDGAEDQAVREAQGGLDDPILSPYRISPNLQIASSC